MEQERMKHREASDELIENEINHLLDHVRTVTEAEEKNTEYRLRTEGLVNVVKFLGAMNITLLLGYLAKYFM